MSPEHEIQFKALWGKWYNSLVGFCIKYLNDREEAMDCVSDCFLHILKSVDADKITKQLLFVSVQNRSLDILRKRKRDRPLLQHLTYHLNFPDEIDMIEAEAIAIIYERIKLLPKKTKKVLIYTSLGESTGKIAARLNTSNQSVLNMKQYGIGLIRNYLYLHKLNINK